jgi:hypothetical protein
VPVIFLRINRCLSHREFFRAFNRISKGVDASLRNSIWRLPVGAFKTRESFSAVLYRRFYERKLSFATLRTFSSQFLGELAIGCLFSAFIRPQKCD